MNWTLRTPFLTQIDKYQHCRSEFLQLAIKGWCLASARAVDRSVPRSDKKLRA
jgi:hypothetical protein